MFNELHTEPPTHPGNPGYATWVRFDFEREDDSSDTEQWVEEVDLIELLKDALAEAGWNARREEHWLVTDNGFWLKPQFVEHAHTEEAIQTTTTIEVAHLSLLSQSCFEYQHSISEESATDSMREGLIRWVHMDWKTFDDLASSTLQHCQQMEMTFPDAEGADHPRKVLFGPVRYVVTNPVPEAPDDEHTFCPCCLFTNTIKAFEPQLHAKETFGVRLFASRGADGEVMADCRVNGEDWEAGAEALREYVRSWPECGYEYRKQYVLIV
ncbi:hypothetical protein G7048_27820 (plasmid) [Diaphorobacter sp. HDW4B]|uniref:DUF6348 family protein n=1 Tax=Diaphorobacter sp. HDW4B TaxID=2714925 RepID=UPI00140CB372|nr:DUF6348 family protein [Diaphorobacter sp. HDW4B]QIL74276.1 hypothetical protein G7048_27820 [Diaphorobacter sp. HDW4B]